MFKKWWTFLKWMFWEKPKLVNSFLDFQIKHDNVVDELATSLANRKSDLMFMARAFLFYNKGSVVLSPELKALASDPSIEVEQIVYEDGSVRLSIKDNMETQEG